MSRRAFLRGLPVSIACLLSAAAGLCLAAEPSADSAAELVRQALRAELAGDNQLRRQKLEAAATRNPDCAPAQWLQGKLQLPGHATWTAARDVTPPPAQVWEAYSRMRDEYLRIPEVVWSSDPTSGPRIFRCRLELPVQPAYGELRLAAVRNLSVAINGRELAVENTGRAVGLAGIQKHLKPGVNTLSVRVELADNAPGLLAWLGCTFADEQVRSTGTGPDWEVHVGPLTGWNDPYATSAEWNSVATILPETSPWDTMRREILSPRLDAALARWCSRRALLPQARFHWMRVVASDPLDEDATRALQLKREDGLLWTHDELAERREDKRQAEFAQVRWKGRLEKLQKVVATDDQQQIAQCIKEWQADLSPTAAPLLSSAAVASGDSQFVATVCELLEQIPEPAATEGLVQIAIFSDMEEIRNQTLKRLVSRNGAGAAPFLLPMLQLPLQIQTRQFVHDAQQNTVLAERIVFVDRRADHDVVHLDERSFLFRPYLGHSYRVWRHKIDANGDGAIDRTDLDLMKNVIVPAVNKELKASAISLARESLQSQMVVARKFTDIENLRREILNQRVLTALEQTTAQKVNRRISSWWDWWIQCNSLAMSPVRGIKVNRRTAWGVQSYEYRTAGWCCFTAGTPVWTRRGLVPVETIRAGDEVLSQDTETGELAYKLVTFTTIRPPSPVVTLTAGGDSVTTTLGHRFWRSGAGWTMAKQVIPGVPLHRMDGSHPVDLVTPAGNAPAYNLVVDDFHTYFVGEAGWLVHDNRIPLPGNAVLPGLLAEPGEITSIAPGCGLLKDLSQVAGAPPGN